MSKKLSEDIDRMLEAKKRPGLWQMQLWHDMAMSLEQGNRDIKEHALAMQRKAEAAHYAAPDRAGSVSGQSDTTEGSGTRGGLREETGAKRSRDARGPEERGETPNPSCDKSCGPSDYYPGGKCDRNGCYTGPAQRTSGTEPAEEELLRAIRQSPMVLVPTRTPNEGKALTDEEIERIAMDQRPPLVDMPGGIDCNEMSRETYSEALRYARDHYFLPAGHGLTVDQVIEVRAAIIELMGTGITIPSSEELIIHFATLTALAAPQQEGADWRLPTAQQTCNEYRAIHQRDNQR